MSKEFYVIVNEQSVTVREAIQNLSVHHAKAIVDGEEYFYQIVKDVSNVMDAGSSKVKNAMFGRGVNEVFYHAKNAGNVVRFVPIGRKTSKHQKKISDKQKGLF